VGGARAENAQLGDRDTLDEQSTVHTLWIQTERLLLDQHRNSYTGRIGGRGIPRKQGLLWVADGSDYAANLEQWAQVYLQQHGQLGVLNGYVIQQVTMRVIVINTTNLPEMRDLLQQSMTWPNEQTTSRELTYTEGPWEQDNRDSVLEQGYETFGLPPQACCPNKDFTHRMPIVVSGLRDIDNPVSSITPEVTQERYLDYF
jgi:hypothetical protein